MREKESCFHINSFLDSAMWDFFNKLHDQKLKEYFVHSFWASDNWTTDNFVFSWFFCLKNIGVLVPLNSTYPITPLVPENSLFFGLRPQDLFGTSSSVRTQALSFPLWHVWTAVMPPLAQVAWQQCRLSPGHSPGGSACTALLTSERLAWTVAAITRTLWLWCKEHLTHSPDFA